MIKVTIHGIDKRNMKYSRKETLFIGVLLCVGWMAHCLGQDEFTQAKLLYEKGDFLEASRILARSCPEKANCGEGRSWLGRTYLKLHQFDDAIRELESAVNANPGDGQHHRWLAMAYGRKAERASIFSALGLARKVGAEFEMAQKLEPNNADIASSLLEFYLQAPGIAGGGRDKAVAQAQKMESMSKVLGHVARAKLYRQDKKWAEAKEELFRCTLNYPTEPEAFEELASFLFERQEYSEAQGAAAKALALKKRSPVAQLVFSAASIQQGQELTLAETNLRQLYLGPLRDEDPEFHEVYYWLGMALLRQREPAKAREAFLTSLKYNPEYPKAKSALSQLEKG